MRRLVTAVAAICLSTSAPASAQSTWDRWQVSAGGAWTGAQTPPDDATYRRWIGGASADVEIARFWTSHLWTGVRAGIASGGDAYLNEPVPVPGSPYPVYRYAVRRYDFRDAAVLGGFRFFDNEWVHPYVAAGVRVDRIGRRETTPAQALPGSGLPTAESSRTLSPLVRVQPVADAGLDVFVTDRAFLRSGLVFVVDHGVARLSWHAAVGVGF